MSAVYNMRSYHGRDVSFLVSRFMSLFRRLICGYLGWAPTNGVFDK